MPEPVHDGKVVVHEGAQERLGDCKQCDDLREEIGKLRLESIRRDDEEKEYVDLAHQRTDMLQDDIKAMELEIKDVENIKQVAVNQGFHTGWRAAFEYWAGIVLQQVARVEGGGGDNTTSKARLGRGMGAQVAGENTRERKGAGEKQN